MNYDPVALGDVCEFLDNKRVPVTESDRKPGPYPYYGANGQQGWIDGYIFDEPLVLLAEDGGSFGSKTKPIAYKITGKTWVNNHAHVLRPKSTCDVDYLHRILSYYDVTKYVNGTTRQKLTKGNAEDIRIPLPTMPEQRRIAVLLSRADRLRRLRRVGDSLSASLLQSVFLEMFGDPVTNKKCGQLVELGDYAFTTSGGTPNRDRAEYFGGNIPWVKSGELHNSYVDDTEEKITKLGMKNSSAKLMPAGTVLIAMYGATVGAVSTLRIEATTNQAVCCIQPKKELNRVYLACILRVMNNHLLDQRVGGAQPNINQQIIRELRIPVPPLPEQEQFASVVRRVESLRARAGESARQVEGLFQSMLSEAFRV